MTTRTLRTWLGFLLAVTWAGGAWVSVAAQAQAQKTPPATKTATAPAAAHEKAASVDGAIQAPAAGERPAPPESYTYRSEGRRDPFLSLVNRAMADNRPAQKKPEGLRGLSWDEITLRGIFMGRNAPVALVQGPNTKTYQVHVGDQLYDAVVKAITADSLVVLQEVNDPLSLQKQRERRKTLRVAEEVK